MKHKDPTNTFANVAKADRQDLSEKRTNVPNDNTFTKYHLAISADDYFDLKDEGIYSDLNAKINPDVRLSIAKIEDPTAEDFLYHLQRVGAKYGWDKRKKYQPENIATIQEMIEARKSDLFVFLADGQEVGFCMTAGIDKFRAPDRKRPYEKGIEKSKAVNMFMRRQGMEEDHIEPIEIYKIGLHDEHTGQGYGNYFLSRIMDIMFRKKKYDMIYLDTRDTNHKGVLKFYANNGVDVFHQETLPSDLVTKTHQWDKHRYHAVAVDHDNHQMLYLPHLSSPE